MVWEGQHHSILAEPGMMDHVRQRLHVLEELQHERLALRLRGDRRRDSRT